MTVCVTTARTPSASTPAAWPSSTSSSTSVAHTSAYRRATPTGLTSCPSDRSMAAAGPLSARPPTIGLTATVAARRAATALRMPGTARIGPIEISGLDGAITIRSADPRASRRPAPVGRLGAVQAHAADGVPLSASHEVRLEVELPGIGPT
jgi:hypothetical protein